jgi:hypothetical protein
MLGSFDTHFADFGLMTKRPNIFVPVRSLDLIKQLWEIIDLPSNGRFADENKTILVVG